MKWNHTWNRAWALTLAVITVATSANFTASKVEAAFGQIVFREKIGENEFKSTDITGVVEGYSVSAQTSAMSGEFAFTDTPFTFSTAALDSGDVNPNWVAGTKTGNDALITVNGLPTGSDSTMYTAVPVVTRMMTDGWGNMSYKDISDPDNPKSQNIPVTVKAKSPISISSDLHEFKFTYQPNGQIAIVSGSFKGTWKNMYDRDGTTIQRLESSADQREITILLHNPSSNNMTLVLSGLPDPATYTKATFTVTYTFEKVNDLTLFTYTREKAIADIITDIDKNFVFTSSDTGKGLPYLKFQNQTDNIGQVTKPFDLLTNFYKYNAPMKIDWKAYDLDQAGNRIGDDESQYLVIRPVGIQEQTTVQIKTTPKDDQRVELEGTIKFREEDTPTGIIKKEIVLQGSGTMPSFGLDQWTKWINIDGKKVLTTLPDRDPALDVNLQYATFPENAVPPVGGWPMEVYDGTESHIAPPLAQSKWGVNRLRGIVGFGTGQAEATRLEISTSSDSKGEVELFLGGAANGPTLTTTPYVISNTPGQSSEQVETLTFVARGEGKVNITIRFFNTQEIRPPINISLDIRDNSPSKNGLLESLKLTAVKPNFANPDLAQYQEAYDATYPNDNIEYSFDTTKEGSYDIQVGNVIEEVKLTPSYFYKSPYTEQRPQVIGVSVDNSEWIYIADEKTYGVDNAVNFDGVDTGQATLPISLREGSITKIAVKAYAENGQSYNYNLNITRARKSDDSALYGIIVENMKTDEAYPISPEFNSQAFNYKVTVPYSARENLRITADANSTWAKKPTIEILDGAEELSGGLLRIFRPSGVKEIKINYDDSDPENVQRTAHLQIIVEPEDKEAVKSTYNLEITVEEPHHDTTLKTLGILRNKDRIETPLQGNGFDPQIREYYASVPYTTESLILNLEPNDERALKVSVEHNGQLIEKDYKGAALEIPYKNLKQDAVNPDPALNTLTFKIWVTAEDGWPLDDSQGRRDPDDFYLLTVERTPADPEARLLSLDVVDTATNSAVPNYTFNNLITQYDFEVPYTMESVIVTPKAMSSLAAVTVNGKKITENMPSSQPIKLTLGSVTKIEVLVMPESGAADAQTYVLNITRKNPSNAAYLSNLTAGGLKFLPDPTPFDKKKTSYKIEIPKGTTTLPVTATLLKDGSKDDSSNATITIEGVTVKDGEAFNYQPTDKTGKITIVVTAQDGKTKRTYTITFKNWNLLIPNDEDTLKDLWVDYGDMQPEFSPAVTEYDVYVKPDAMDLKIYPKLKDKDGDIEVTAESKVLTQFEDYYSTSLMDDEMDIHIYVWSEKAVVESASSNTNTDAANTKPARSAAREYILHVYRNDEEKIGSLKPVTADMVDFTSADPIVIDITKYTVISAEVFNTLKTDYADKSIIFKGNDYTLQVFGADIDGLVPNAESFDLKFSFRTPDEDKILDIIDDSGRNGDIEPVYYYFNQHGALPGEMLLTVDLGRHYRNTELYWNYYNKERERIDYYGYVHTNAKGTFSVPISHFSTYLSTEDKIRGAENKSDEYGNPLLTPETENLNAPRSADKAIPNTGAGVTG